MKNNATAAILSLEANLNELRSQFIASYSEAILKEFKLAEAMRYEEDFNLEAYSTEEISRLQRQYLNLYENKFERTEAKLVKLAEKAWAKRYATLVKGIARKGVNLDELVKCSVKYLGNDVKVYVEDANGNTASAYSIVACGDYVKAHYRFICR